MKSGYRIVAIYDVACQWYRNFLKRVAAGKYLSLPSRMVVVPAVGKVAPWGTHFGVLS